MSEHAPRTDDGDPHAGATAFVGVVGGIALVLAFVALQAYFRHVVRAELHTKVVSRPEIELNRLRSRQIEKLSGYRWIDPDRGIVGIPIERAMEIVTKELESTR